MINELIDCFKFKIYNLKSKIAAMPRYDILLRYYIDKNIYVQDFRYSDTKRTALLGNGPYILTRYLFNSF